MKNEPTPRTLRDAFGDSHLDTPGEPLTVVERVILVLIWLTSAGLVVAACAYLWELAS